MKRTDQDIIAESIELYISPEILTESKIKMKPEHYQELKKRISNLADKIPAHVDSLKQDDKYRPDASGKMKGDLGMRVRWDVFHATKMSQDHKLYDELNDSHIDSALKSAFKELNIKDGSDK